MGAENAKNAEKLNFFKMAENLYTVSSLEHSWLAGEVFWQKVPKWASQIRQTFSRGLG